MTVPKKRAPKIDGRRLRSERTRASILGALLALVKDGNVAPSAPQIAAKAGVALRSIAQHFPSREALFAAAAAAYRDVAPRTEAVDVALARDERVVAFAAKRADVLETTAPYRLTATIMAAQSHAVHDGLRVAARLRRAEVAAAFAPELERIAGRAKAEILDALDAAASGRAWDAWRDDMQLAPRAAQARMAMVLSAILATIA
ncbi:MAG TPA: TetR family transcriptional regulator [Kofleriaceae bacterium]|nr:TetR family transcriptional regulator [Kofleriaceae bacterium]